MRPDVDPEQIAPSGSIAIDRQLVPSWIYGLVPAVDVTLRHIPEGDPLLAPIWKPLVRPEPLLPVVFHEKVRTLAKPESRGVHAPGPVVKDEGLKPRHDGKSATFSADGAGLAV